MYSRYGNVHIQFKFPQSYQTLNTGVKLQQETKRNTILPPALEVTLNKSAMVAKFPQNVLYCPNFYQGLNIQHPCSKQGIQKMTPCIQECAIGSKIGNLIKTLAEEFMIETRMPLTLGTVNWDIVGEYITPCWFGILAKFISTQELDIMENFDRTLLLRQNDD